MTRARVFLFATALALAVPGLAAVPDRAVLVDLTAAVDAAEVERLKRGPGVRWWIEAGEVLLLAGDDVATLRSGLPSARVLADLGTVDRDRLALHARGCGDNTDRVAPELLLIPGASYDLVRRPRAFAPVPPAVRTAVDAHLGAPEWQAVAPNSRIARQHRFDRPAGAPPPDPGIVPIVDRVYGRRWFDDVSTLAAWDRSSWSPQLPAARQWIASQFADLGLAVSEPTFHFPPGGTPAPIANVIGRIEGSELPGEWIVVGGHYDSRNINNNAAAAANTPGADDNASGCAGVIEAARAVIPFRPRRSIVFMCYAGEEQGLHGSHGHVNGLLASGDLHRVEAMLNMDMIGWSADAQLGVVLENRVGQQYASGNQALLDLLGDAGLTYAPTLNPALIVKSTNSCCSDHMPYVNAARPALMSIHRGRASTYPHYHRDTDTPANLGPFAQDIAAAIVRMNVAALAQLAGASDAIFADDHEGSVTPP